MNRYAEIQNQTASRERLMVMLFEAALRHMRTAAAALEQRRPDDARTPLGKASDIISELQATLDPSRAPDLSKQLADLYQFCTLRLLKATLNHDPKLVREAERAFAPIVEAFCTAVASLPNTGTGR